MGFRTGVGTTGFGTGVVTTRVGMGLGTTGAGMGLRTGLVLTGLGTKPESWDFLEICLATRASSRSARGRVGSMTSAVEMFTRPDGEPAA